MGRKEKAARQFWESAIDNRTVYDYYFNRLKELCMSRFEWDNLPETVDERYLELCEFETGQSIFFKDDVIGYLALRNTAANRLNVYGYPIGRRAKGVTGASWELDETNSVLIYNNYLHYNDYLVCDLFAKRLANLDRTIDVNTNAQKHPIVILCDENERLTFENIYMNYDGNKPLIKGSKGLDLSGFTTLDTGAPYVSDKLYELKTNIWNEALTCLGISNVAIQKKERMVTDEVTRQLGGTFASRYSALESRRTACKQINAMFGLNVTCDYRNDYEGVEPADDQDEPGGEEVGIDE